MSDDTRHPSVYDVATHAGVSTASVSRYFRSPGKVSEATRERIAESVEQLGYVPSGNARGLAERRTGMIGLYSFSGHEPDELERLSDRGAGTVVRIDERTRAPRLYPLFADEVLRGVELECTTRRIPLAVGWQLGADGGVQLDDIAQRSDGLIVLPATIDNPHLRRLARRMPVVLVSQPVPDDVAAMSVGVDDEGGMQALAAHLTDDHAVRRVWFVGPDEGSEHEARLRGLTAVLAARGLTPPERPFVTNGSRRGTHDALASAFAAEPALADTLPDAIVCSSDQAALGVVAALSERGIRVPRDVAVTGFDGIDAGRFSTPPLTTVRQPMDELGREAVALIAARLRGDRADDAVVLPVALVVRASCGCA